MEPGGQICHAPVVALRIGPQGREVALDPTRRRVRLGSSARCDVVIADPLVAALHAVVENRPDGRAFVRDLGTVNGTYLDGVRIDLAEIRPGASLRIGATEILALDRKRSRSATAFAQLRGEDSAFRGAVDMAVRAAQTDCSVLIVGETGTGKELVARAIHEGSPRASGPLVAVNCGAISQELIGSELFGHERGAFTGATSSRDGVFVQASGGTLFLDELGELPGDQQPHLLRVLETRKVRRIGGSREQRIDVRLVAATNRLANLGTSASPLRLDLFHRVATVVVPLPPLRQRPGDVPLLVRSFMAELAGEFGERRVSRSTMRALVKYPWPGNVRELRQAVKRAMTLCSEELTLDQLLPHQENALVRSALAGPPRRAKRGRSVRTRICPQASAALRPIDVIIRDAMVEALEQSPSMRSAAQSLGLAKSTFADWARRLGIAVE